MGTGEGLADLEYFQADRVAQRMLDMGDLATLLEQAESKLADQEKRKRRKQHSSRVLTLQDFADQLAMVDKIGSIQQIMKYIPGMGTVDPQVLQQGEKDLKSFERLSVR